MATKAKKETVETPAVEVKSKPAAKAVEKNTKPKWEIKDRVYHLKGKNSPLTYTIPGKHSARFPLLWFNEEEGMQYELRYATNQNSPLVSEQKGQVTLGHIVFSNGSLYVPKEKQALQKLLSLYHPGLNKKYYEFNAEVVAKDELSDLEFEIEALNAALNLDIDIMEAILRVEVGSAVSKMSSKELKRDILLFAKRQPILFLELANDENVQLRNMAIRAVEAGFIKLSQDQRTFSWASNGRKLMTVPFDENPYSAMAAFFKTDEGVDVYRSVEKNLN